MKKEELDRLIARYYDGSASNEDEKRLKAFFSRRDIPAGYETEKAIFSFLSGYSEIIEASADLEERIISRLDTKEKKGIARKYLTVLSGVAAAIIIMIGSWFFFVNNSHKDTYDDPELAYSAAVRILYDVSSKLNQGALALEPVSKMNIPVEELKMINETQNTIGKSFKSFEHLEKAIDIATP